MYKSYSFWRESPQPKKDNRDIIKPHGSGPIHITNTQKIYITRDNIKSFLEEGERAKMQRLMQENNVPANKVEITEKHDQEKEKKIDDISKLKLENKDDSTMSQPDSEMTDSSIRDEKCSLDEAKEYLTQYGKILHMFSKFDIGKLCIISSRMYGIYDQWKDDLVDCTIELKIHDSLKSILEHYAINDLDDSTNSVNLSYDLVTSILGMLNDWTDLSATYSKMVMKNGIFKYCARWSEHPPFVKNHETNKRIEGLLDSLVTVLHNCIRHVPGDPLYDEEKIKQVVEPYLSSKVNVLRVLSIMITSALISEDENTKMEHAGVIPYMVQSFDITLSSADRRYDGFMAVEFLECLIRIAANDSNKIKIIEAGILPGLVMTLNEGDEQEQINAAKLLWVLCFDEDAKSKVVEEPGCLDAIKKHSNSDDSEIKRMANGALWKIQGKEIYQEKHQIEDKPTDENEKHIFISYQWDHQKMVLKVKDRLKANGYKVWIDVEQMGGSTLESMADAVENAKVVLLCASEKYKISPNCRTEAEYIFQLKRPIVPLMLQRYYKPDGWLGMLFGAKFFVNFDGKYEFDYAYGLLLKELQKYTNADSTVAVKPMDVTDGAGRTTFTRPLSAQSSTYGTRLELKCEKWTTQQVKEWVAENKLYSLSSKLDGMFENMDGESLGHLLKLKKEAPDYFYKEIKREYDLNLPSVVQLMKVFDTLLKKK